MLYFIACIYNILTIPFIFIITPFFFFHRRGKLFLKERFGFWDKNKNILENTTTIDQQDIVWFHGASLGEIQGIESVIKEVKDQFENYSILITSISNTGKDYGSKLTNFSRLIPFDNIFLIYNAVSKLRIKCLVITETELWPSLLFYAYLKNIPVVYINFRISDLTFKKYYRIKCLLKPFLEIPVKIFCSNIIQSKRVSTILDTDRNLSVIGNTKYDKNFTDIININKLKKMYFENDDPTIILGSIRPGEEKFWLEPLKLKSSIYKFNLIVAPRHKEKFDFFENILKQYDFDSIRKSNLINNIPNKIQTLLLDSYGDLDRIYSFCDLAFIGGTFINIGGHNPLEASKYGVYVIVGPYNFVISDVLDELVNKKAAQILQNKDQVNSLLEEFFLNIQTFKINGENGKAVYTDNIGATKHAFEYIKELII